LIGREDQYGELQRWLREIPDDLTSKDTLPVEIRELVRGEKAARSATWDEVEAAAAVCTKDFQGTRAFAKKRGFRRWTIRALAEHFGSQDLLRWADAEIFWDTVVSIEPAGEEETFDLEAPGNHNFVANGLFVHNSHSAAYGLVAYQTAYLKANHPIEFMAAVATSEIGHSAIGNENKENKLVTYLEEARGMGISVLPPDVQRSGSAFTIEENAIRFGLVAVKNVGEGAVDSMLKARQETPFRNLDDFCARVDLHAANKKVLESLIKAGAMDSLATGDSPGSLAVIAGLCSARIFRTHAGTGTST
jgi:DNA polymerase-3 subunit alpha